MIVFWSYFVWMKNAGRSKDRGKIYHGKARQALGSYSQLDRIFLGMYGIGLPVIGVEFAQHFLCIYD
jgi:hypothetical protein